MYKQVYNTGLFPNLKIGSIISAHNHHYAPRTSARSSSVNPYRS